MDRSLFLSLSLRSMQLVDRCLLLEFWLQMNPNTPKFGVRWPRKPLYLNHGIKSFILEYNLSRFENVCIFTPNDPKYPNFGVGWPRMTSKTTFSLSRDQEHHFENVWILTPNDPQVTPTSNLQNKKFLCGFKLQFKLSQALIGRLCNEIFEKQAFSGSCP